MEQIQFQIERALWHISLAKPNSALWSGSAANQLSSALERLESELHHLRNSLLL